MTIRETVKGIIVSNPAADPDEIARLIVGALVGMGAIEPGNGWLDDDGEMRDDLDRVFLIWNRQGGSWS